MNELIEKRLALSISMYTITNIRPNSIFQIMQKNNYLKVREGTFEKQLSRKIVVRHGLVPGVRKILFYPP